MATDKFPTSIRLTEKEYEKVRYLAYVEHRSINGLVGHMIKTYIQAYEKKYGVITPPEPSGNLDVEID